MISNLKYRRRGVSSMIYSGLSIALVVVAIAILAVIIFNLVQNVQDSIAISECKSLYATGDKYASCLRERVGDRYLDLIVRTLENSNIDRQFLQLQYSPGNPLPVVFYASMGSIDQVINLGIEERIPTGWVVNDVLANGISLRNASYLGNWSQSGNVLKIIIGTNYNSSYFSSLQIKYLVTPPVSQTGAVTFSTISSVVTSVKTAAYDQQPIIISNDSISATVATSTCDTSVTNGLYAFYCFNGNTTDKVNPRNSMRTTGGISFDNEAGENFVKFNGNTSYLTTSPFSRAFNDSMTVSFWIKDSPDYPGKDENYALLANIPFYGEQAHNFYILYNTGGWNRNNTNDTGYIEYISSGCWAFGVYITNNSLWHHVVVQRFKDGYRIYLDGNLKTSAHCDSYGFNYDTQVNFGNPVGNLEGHIGNKYYNGSLDNLMLYNRILSPTEIQTLFDER